jgi:predicted lipoprotein with Yx(FWY)xxD motif
MRRAPRLLVLALLCGTAGCGGAPAADRAKPVADAPQEDAAPEQATPARSRSSATGTRITLRRSAFGRVLFDGRRQAIYIFENDRRGETVCYGECAEAWPPVYTRGAPRARAGVRADLLGTIRRRDGRRQVTYAGRPLYYYAHEGPGEVRCHNVDLNGGFWWVVGRDGRRRP